MELVSCCLGVRSSCYHIYKNISIHWKDTEKKYFFHGPFTMRGVGVNAKKQNKKKEALNY